MTCLGNDPESRISLGQVQKQSQASAHPSRPFTHPDFPDLVDKDRQFQEKGVDQEAHAGKMKM